MDTVLRALAMDAIMLIICTLITADLSLGH
jgi:hypothetical protein